MDLTWHAEPSPRWDADKRRVVGAWPGSFPTLVKAHDGAVLPGQWWRASLAGATVGYGWMDVTWGDAEVWLAAAREVRGQGVGSFMMQHLEHEARSRGIRYMYNAIPAHHREPSALQHWLEKQGFGLSGDGLYKRSV